MSSLCKLFCTREIDTCVFSVSNQDYGPVVVVIVWPLRMMSCLRRFELSSKSEMNFSELSFELKVV